MSITGRLRSYFLRGLAALLPTMLTIWVLVWGYRFIQENFSVYINRGIVWLIYNLQPETQYFTKQELINFWVYGWGSIAGFIIALIIVCFVGILLASVIGRTLWRTLEKLWMNTPVLKKVYPYVKQITDFLLTQQNKEKIFSRVVAVQYPRKGIWSIGLVTGTGLKEVNESLEKDVLAILIPTSPTPFTGFIIMVPRDETIELDLGIDEALRFVISGGVITPSTQLKEPTEKQLEKQVKKEV